MRATRRRPLDLVAFAALLSVALYLVLAVSRGSGTHAARRSFSGAHADFIDASAWNAALSAGAEAVRHASAPRRAMSVR